MQTNIEYNVNILRKCLQCSKRISPLYCELFNFQQLEHINLLLIHYRTPQKYESYIKKYAFLYAQSALKAIQGAFSDNLVYNQQLILILNEFVCNQIVLAIDILTTKGGAK